jgi:hypothetical protein
MDRRHSRQHHRSQIKRRHNGKAPVFDRFTVEGDSWLAESWSQLSPPP